MQGRREHETTDVRCCVLRGSRATENAADGSLSLAAYNIDLARADELWDEIAAMGYAVQDTPQGPVLVPRK